MIVIIGLLVLIASVVVAIAGVASNGGSTHPLGHDFGVFGQQITGLSIGDLFLYGIVVGVAGMLGLSMLLGVFNKRLASRRSRRELKQSRSETEALRAERDQLNRQLEAERAERLRSDTPIATTTTPGVETREAPTASAT